MAFPAPYRVCPGTFAEGEVPSHGSYLPVDTQHAEQRLLDAVSVALAP